MAQNVGMKWSEVEWNGVEWGRIECNRKNGEKKREKERDCPVLDETRRQDRSCSSSSPLLAKLFARYRMSPFGYRFGWPVSSFSIYLCIHVSLCPSNSVYLSAYFVHLFTSFGL
ncbi:hypothetical protein LOAG_02767 [Loa loa]|uniref:Uncharacterized protein n=1 Tax=Loa loa TaxID=7209 RepID=A0A1S0U7X1_LOALO|nr:hypothetical protein LOAG_02767 [Loa loa]EFO25724.1 hypothetical protein LOAG_02767 [Loa loa]